MRFHLLLSDGGEAGLPQSIVTVLPSSPACTVMFCGKRAFIVGSWLMARIRIPGFLAAMLERASAYASVPSASRNGGSSINSIPSWMPALRALMSARPRVTASAILTFSPPLWLWYGRLLPLMLLIQTSRLLTTCWCCAARARCECQRPSCRRSWLRECRLPGA